jgi:hypothetical protein
MTLDLDETETAAPIRLLRERIDGGRYPLLPRIRTLKAILNKLKLRPEPARPAASPEPIYEHLQSSVPETREVAGDG